jgi:hypothetical protein
VQVPDKDFLQDSPDLHEFLEIGRFSEVTLNAQTGGLRLIARGVGGTGYDDGDGGEPLALTNGGQNLDPLILRQIQVEDNQVRYGDVGIRSFAPDKGKSLSPIVEDGQVESDLSLFERFPEEIDIPGIVFHQENSKARFVHSLASLAASVKKKIDPRST